jgi:hypothetical protein
MTEGMENPTFVDTNLGIGENACALRLINSSANHRCPRAMAEHRSVVEGRVGGTKAVASTGGRARVGAVEAGGVGMHTEDHVGRAERKDVAGVVFGTTKEAVGGFKGGFSGLGLAG